MAEIHSVEGLAAYAHQQIERIERMQRELAAQSGLGTSARGLVQARTGPAGALHDLQVDPRALQLTPGQLADEVKSAITAAQADYGSKADAVMTPIVGAWPGKEIIQQRGLGGSFLAEHPADGGDDQRTAEDDAGQGQ